MSSSLRVKVDERLDIARLVEQHKQVLFSQELSEEQKNEAWSRILAECTSRGHHWVKGKDVTYLKKSKWPGIKRDAIEHYQADMKGDVSHRKKLTEADVIVLKAISFDTENLGCLAEKEINACTLVGEAFDADVTQPVTVEVKTGEPLDLLSCGMKTGGESEKFESGLLVDLFSKNRQEPRRSFFSSDQEHRYSKRHRVDDDGPIDHDLMAALGFGKNRQKRTEEGMEKIITRPPERETNQTVTTVGDYLRSVHLPPKEDDMVLFSPVTVDRKPPLEHPKCPPPLPPPPPVQKVTNITSSVTSVASPKENCRDLKTLQRKAYEAQIAREEAMTKYYQLKAKKLELEIAQLQQGENGVAGRP